MYFVSGLGTIGSTCNKIRTLTDIPSQWPDISPIKHGINSVYSALEPMLDFFKMIQSALSEDLCIPNPLEALSEWEKLE